MIFFADGIIFIDFFFIYIYIYSHPQTDCFVLSELFSVARHAGRSKLGSKPVQLYVRLCFRPLGYGNFKVFLFLETAAAAFVYIFFIPYQLPECSILSKSFALCSQQPAIPSPESSTPMGEHILSSIDRLFCSIRTLQCG